MDQRFLKTTFIATGAVSVLVGIVGALINPTWGLRYSVVAALALANWFALAKVISGMLGRNSLDVIVGLLIKPLLLVTLLVVAKLGMIEITSFLLGINTFFLTLFGCMAFRAIAPSNRFLMAGSETNG